MKKTRNTELENTWNILQGDYHSRAREHNGGRKFSKNSEKIMKKFALFLMGTLFFALLLFTMHMVLKVS